MKLRYGLILTAVLSVGGGFSVFAASDAPPKPASPPAAEAKSDGGAVVAKVDGTEITVKMVEDEIDRMTRTMGPRMAPGQMGQKNAMFFSDALNGCINLTLLKNVAKTQKLTVEAAEIDTKIAEIKKNFPTEDAFKTALSQQGLSEEKIRESLKENLLFQKVIDKNVKNPAPATDEAVKKFYDDNIEKYFTEPEQVKASHILLQVKEKSTADEKAAIKKKLSGYKADIVANKITFEDAAKKYSEDPTSGVNGGDLNYFPKGSMVKEFEEAAFTTDVGKMTDIVETKFGYHLIKVTDHKKVQKVPLDTVKDKIKSFLEGKGKQEAYQNYLELLKKTAKIENVITQEQWAASHAPKAGGKQEIQIDPGLLKDN